MTRLLRASARAACVSGLLAAALASQSSRPASAPRIRGSFRGVELSDVVRAIAGGRPLDVALLPGVYGPVTIELDHADPLEALAAAAAAAGAEVGSDDLGVLCVSPAAIPFDPGAKPTVLHLAKRDVASGCLEAANAIRPSPCLLVAPAVSGALAPTVRITDGRRAIRAALPDGVAMTECYGVVLIVPRQPREPGGCSFSFDATEITAVAAEIGRLSGRRVGVAPGVSGKVTMYLHDIPWRHALALAAAAASALVVRSQDGSYELRPVAVPRETMGKAGAGGLRVAATGGLILAFPDGRLSVADLASFLSGMLKRPVTLEPDAIPEGNLVCTTLRVADFTQLLHVIARALHADVVELALGELRLSAPPAPKPARKDAQPRVSGSFRGADVREVIRAIAAARRANVSVASSVRGRVTVTLDHADVRSALEAAIARLGAEVTTDEYGVLCVSPSEPAGAPAEPRPLRLGNRELPSAALEAATAADIPLVVGPGVSGTLPESIDLGGGVRSLRAALPDGMALIERDGIFRLVRQRPSVRGNAEFVAEGTEVAAAIERIARQSRLHIVLAPGVEGQLMMRVRDVPWRHLLELAARSVDAFVVRKEDGSYLVRRGDGLRRPALGPARVLVENGTMQVHFAGPTGMRAEDLATWVEGVQWRLTVEAQEMLPQGAVHGAKIRIAPGMPLVRLVADLLERDIVERADGGLWLSPTR